MNPRSTWLASHHYSKMYDMMVESPSEDFLLPIKIYVNKTGKTSGILQRASAHFTTAPQEISKGAAGCSGSANVYPLP